MGLRPPWKGWIFINPPVHPNDRHQHALPGRENTSGQKLSRCAVYATAPATTDPLEWSDDTTTFDSADHPDYVPHPDTFALVVDPIIGGFRLPRVLMDSDSGLNIIFPDTLAKIGTSLSSLQSSLTGFRDFISGGRVRPLGWLKLEVVFEDEDNFRFETIQFEFAPFCSGYSAVLGRLAYVKFMALMPYAYLQLKMPGPSGTITFHGNPERTLEAEVANVDLAGAALASAELEKINSSINTYTTTLPDKPRPGLAF